MTGSLFYIKHAKSSDFSRCGHTFHCSEIGNLLFMGMSYGLVLWVKAKRTGNSNQHSILQQSVITTANQVNQRLLWFANRHNEANVVLLHVLIYFACLLVATAAVAVECCDLLCDLCTFRWRKWFCWTLSAEMSA